MGAFFMQTIAVFSSFDIQWPVELKWLFDISAIFMFDLNGVSVACFHGPGFEGKYWATIVVPLFVILATGVSFGATKVLPVSEAWKMLPNHTFSMLGMLLTALYITLVKVVVAYWECVDNPAADATLAKFRDVVCGSEVHNKVLPAMAIGLIFYVVGFYAFIMHAAYMAPKHWMNVNFRERWKFMLTRWRPDAYYWGTVVMSRNLLVAFAGLVSDQARVQLVFVVVVVVVTFSFTGAYQPWRATMLNHFDVASSIVLTFIGVFGVVFVSITREIQVSQQNGLPTESQENDQASFAMVLSVCIALFLFLFGSLVCWCLSMVMPSNMQKQAEQHEKTCQQLTGQLNEKLSMASFRDEAARLIHESTAYDRNGLKNFLDKINADQTSHKSGTTDTISINKAKEHKSVAETVSA
jgi:hypothetical protein